MKVTASYVHLSPRNDKTETRLSDGHSDVLYPLSFLYYIYTRGFLIGILHVCDLPLYMLYMSLYPLYPLNPLYMPYTYYI